jgi:peptide/nickel transport system permease protein
MLKVIGSRLLQMIPVMIGVTLLAFAVVNLLPGNILYQILGVNYTKASAAVLSRQLHLNQPLIVRYLNWVGDLLPGNLGHSLINGQSVGQALWQAAPPTVELILFAQIIAIFLGVLFAVASVASPTPWVDRVATALSLFGNSVPAFVTALLALLLFADHWHLVSSLGWSAPSQAGWGANLRAMLLPAATLGISVFPGYMRIFRREMQEQLENEEYVTLARMKGISRRRLILLHVARNSALGIITLIALSTGLLVGGAVIIEDIFAMPGIGSLLLQAITNRDATMVEGCIVVIAAAIVVLNLVADLLYALFDPRVRSN